MKEIYIEFLVHLGNINSFTFDEALQDQILLQLEYLQDGISLRLSKADPKSSYIYGKSKSSAIHILLEVETRLVLINKSFKKVRSALFKSLWTGLASMEFPIRWEP